jgi:Mrp family chromosome partitioning ATPase
MPSNDLSVSRLDRSPTVTGLPPVAQADLPAGASPDEALAMIHDREGPAAAAYRTLARQLGVRRVLLTTSAAAGEGKSVAAANLALALAERGDARVLLVDAHFARASVGGLFGLTITRCFAEQLHDHRTGAQRPWQVQRLAAADLCVLPVANGSERALHRPSFAAALHALEGSFDRVIIDGPPALEAAGIDLIQDLADALVVVARTGRTRARTLRALMERVAPAPVAGVLLVD